MAPRQRLAHLAQLALSATKSKTCLCVRARTPSPRPEISHRRVGANPPPAPSDQRHEGHPAGRQQGHHVQDKKYTHLLCLEGFGKAPQEVVPAMSRERPWRGRVLAGPIFPKLFRLFFRPPTPVHTQNQRRRCPPAPPRLGSTPCLTRTRSARPMTRPAPSPAASSTARSSPRSR